MMVNKHLFKEMQKVSLSMFNKNFFGVYHGSISARVSTNSFLINRKETMMDEVNEDSLIHLDCLRRDYRWNTSSADTEIHEQIYQELPHAKCISYTMPPYTTAYSLQHAKLAPRDYFGQTILGEMMVYDPGSFHDWHDRAPYEIANFFKESTSHLILIKGHGVFAYDRDVVEMAKKIALLENSARLLVLANSV